MNNKLYKLMLVVCSASLIIGCASVSKNESNVGDLSGDTNALMAEKDQEIARLTQQLRSVQNACPTDAAENVEECSAPVTTATNLFPPNPKPGECYARVIVPAQYSTSTDRLLVREASERIEIIPAQYGPGEQRVLVKEASSKLQVIPPVYETVTERVMIKPASQKVVEVPPVYKTETERVLDSAARTEWKRGTGIGSGKGGNYGGAAAQITRFQGKKVLETRTAEDTGEVMCLVEIPATYKIIKKKKLVTPASTRVKEIPAVYKTIEKRVLKRPASTKEVAIPAVYKTIRTTQLIKPASERRIPIPEEYQTISKRSKISEEQIVWRPVLCEINMTVQNVSALQSKIETAEPGCWECGRFDGIIGKCTLQATQCYARKHGLSSGDKYVTLELIRHLGLSF